MRSRSTEARTSPPLKTWTILFHAIVAVTAGMENLMGSLLYVLGKDLSGKVIVWTRREAFA
jgi:hypothetical protein